MPASRLLIAISLVCLNLGVSGAAQAQSSGCIDAPPLPEPRGRVINVSTVEELNDALKDVRAKSTIVIQPGRYLLTRTLGIEKDNITIRGATNDCSAVELIGPGMDEIEYGDVEHGFWIDAENTTIANLTIGEIYFHAFQINGKAFAPHIYNVRMYNTGQQFVKSNPVEFGVGVNQGIVEYSVMEYTDGTPKTDHAESGLGYTNGVDVHAGSQWRISNNRFSNFHTPGNSDHLWNAAVLMWNGASDTITENNVFINVDRAVSYGLQERSYDHRGGIIRNNMITMSPDLYSDSRKAASDAVIAVMDSPNTKVLHNTLLTNGNTKLAIELRFDTSGSEVANNIADAPISHRARRFFRESDNITNAQADWFKSPADGNLRLTAEALDGKDKVRAHRHAAFDIDQQRRPRGLKVDIGADEYIVESQ